ncbi:MAG: HAMP domain-containing sensor histidine kinase [Myxococcota bacterium]|nr:HAMP domain-containing sensor histidine kinase [Myxococcota bacterium]
MSARFLATVDAADRITQYNAALVEALGGPPRALEDLAPMLEPRRLERALIRARGGRPVRLSANDVRWSLSRLEGPEPAVLLRGRGASPRPTPADGALDAMGQLTHALAHEIKNPLNIALLEIELLGRGLRNPSAVDHAKLAARVRAVEAEVRGMSRLLDDFLALARPDRLEPEPVRVGGLVEEVVRVLEGPAAAARVTLSTRLDEADAWVDADPARLRLALLQLLSNALDACEGDAGADVRVRTRRRGGTVHVTIEDDGPGLPASPRVLMRPFVSTKSRGTGLGLPLVARIARLHGGRLSLTPRRPRGTRARLILPCAVEVEMAEEAS